MRRWRFARTGIALSLCCFTLAVVPAAGSNSAPRPPNIVLVVADDLGWADLACYGADVHETPHLDRFAAGALRFTHAYSAAPVCTPTRASIMTGKHPARLHMTIWYEASQNPPRDRPLLPPKTVGNLPHSETTLAEVLQEAGYLTAHVGKWHLGDAAHYPQTHGFDINVGGTFWGAPPTYFFPYRGTWSNTDEFRYVPDLEWGEPGEYLTDRLTDEAIRIIRRAGQRPFFLHLAYHTVHTPIEARPEDAERFRRRITPDMRHQNATYAAMVYSLDENVGRLLAALDALDIADETLVVFISDNGGFINPHRGQVVTDNHPLRSGKGSLYDGGLRVPLIIRSPGQTPAGAVCEEPVVSTDLYPTVLAVAGLEGDAEHNRNLDGLDLAPLLADPTSQLPRDALYFHYPHYYPTTTPVSAIRAGRWKLLEYLEDGRVELYDLDDDPGETRDLAAQRAEQADALRQRLDAWRTEIDAQLPRAHR